ncbi:MAG: hypothetical protein Q9160_004138 [Pyrenula sp. 1 TL-2023]
MSNDYKFEGWMGLNGDSAKGNMKWQSYEPKKFEDTDVDIKITHCGICGSDIHTLSAGWGEQDWPVLVGHEIVGTAVRVGPKAEGNIRVGDRVGVGAQSASCLRAECEECSGDMEQHCATKVTNTFGDRYMDGSKSYGGYADYWRGPSHFVFKIPDAIPSEDAAPMMCGGITTYSPLIHNGAGPGKKVGIVGIGGLGHFGLLWAKALGCEKVVAISRSASKKADALKMGADEFIATDDDPDWAKHHSRSLDLIVCTVSSPKMPLQGYLTLLRTNGSFIQVGAPEDKIPGVSAFDLIVKGVKIGGSAIGSPKEIREMLDLAARKRTQPWIQKRPLSEANQVILDMDKGMARYRYTLVNEKHASA